MPSPLKSWWNEYGYIILIIIAIIFFIIIAFIGTGKRNTFEDWIPRHTAPRKRILKKHETRCREIFESIFGRPFPSIRPSFLRRANGRCLELDGYNNQLKLGFEYQGKQHVEYNRLFHRTYDDFIKQKQRDADKRLLCRAAGVRIIEIPHTVRYDDLEKYITLKLKQS